MYLRDIFFMLIGFAIGTGIFMSAENNFEFVASVRNTPSKSPRSSYNEDLAEELFHKVKVLCMIMTNPANHRTKAIHVRNTWGKRCNKLLFITSENDPELDVINLPIVTESRSALRNKTRGAFMYAHDNLLNDFDWFMKADDDSFVIVENLRYMLTQYRPQTALFFGHRLARNETKVEEGYMAGGGYVLSRKALIKFAEIVKRDPSLFSPDGAWEDVRMGKTLGHSAIFVDSRDEMKRERFFLLALRDYINYKFAPDYWLVLTDYYRFKPFNLSGCSDVPILFHYIRPHEMYTLEFMIYHVHPFGLEKNRTEIIQRKLSLDEIIAASDVDSLAPNFIQHEHYHNMTSSEFF